MLETLRDLLDLLFSLDLRTAEAVAALRTPLATKVATSVTGLGSAAAAVVLLGLAYLAGWREEFLTAAVALSVTGVVVATLMGVVARPFPPQPVCDTGGAATVATSFPSGHAAAVTVYALVARRSETLPAGIVAGVAAVVAVSRVYLGTHYLTDTVAGVLIGVGAVLLARRLLARFWSLALTRRYLPRLE